MASVDEISRRRRVTYSQLEALWEILNSHKDLAVGYNKTSQAREYAKRMWESVAQNLNSQGEGAFKTSKGWSSYWVDYKAKLKKRVATIRASSNRTGGGPPDVLPINNLEEKFLRILGEDFGVGLPNTQVPILPTLPPSTSHQPSTSQDENEAVTQESPEPPAVTPHTNSPLPTVNNNTRPVRRRRRISHARMTQEAAQRILVDSSAERLAIARRQLEIWEQILPVLSRIADSLERTSRGPETGDESAPHS